MLLSLLFPSGGSGKVFGMDIVTEGPAIKQIVGFVPSEVHYYNKMTVRELLQYNICPDEESKFKSDDWHWDCHGILRVGYGTQNYR